MAALINFDWHFLSDEEMAEVCRLATLRNEGKENLPTTRVYGEPGRTPFANDVRGVMGEWLVEKLLGKPMDRRQLRGGDQCDFINKGHTIDVKTAPHQSGHLIFNHKSEFKTDFTVVVIAQPGKKRAKLDCWITKEDFLKLAKKHDFGYGPRWAVPLARIRELNNGT